MRATAVVVCLFMAMAGCKKGGGGGDACRSSLDHAASLATTPANLAPEQQKYVAALMTAVTDASAKRCSTDHWSADITTCLTGAKTNEDSTGCLAKLPPQQKDALDKDINAAADALKNQQQPPH